ncbi:MAG: tRNA uridine-5-carboxymethylaminomethyl(34) synthesis GTPase MnmE [Candidatus Eisenbacteria bacterium]
MQPIDDTITAIATAPGAAGLAVLRVSGVQALAMADAVFRGSAPLAEAAGHTLHHGWAVDAAGARLDEVVAAVFRAPRSYTGEDTVELSCHGGGVSAGRVLAAVRAAGARLAGPGEFTLRAYLHGRLDLAQAEAVADLVHAETDSAGDLALGQLAGALSARVRELEERITDATAEVEARVDFAEDVGGIETPAHVRTAIAEASAALDALLAGAPWARAVREGVRVPLVGRPNAGKSSLFNALLGEDRAIVTAEPGTTRDRVSEKLHVAGVPVTLSDTAGVRMATNPVEAMGVARALAALEGAAVVVWVVDGTQPLEAAGDMLVASLPGRRVLVAVSKSDLPNMVTDEQVAAALKGAEHAVVRVSAVAGSGLAELREALAVLLGAGRAGGLAGAVSNPRHTDALSRARAALERAAAAAQAGAPGEIVALELRESLAALGEVTGRNASEELLERIFARFCIGK